MAYITSLTPKQEADLDLYFDMLVGAEPYPITQVIIGIDDDGTTTSIPASEATGMYLDPADTRTCGHGNAPVFEYPVACPQCIAYYS